MRLLLEVSVKQSLFSQELALGLHAATQTPVLRKSAVAVALVYPARDTQHLPLGEADTVKVCANILALALIGKAQRDYYVVKI